MKVDEVEVHDAKFDFSWRLGLVALKPKHRKEIQAAHDRALLAVHVDVCPNERSDGASCGGINGYLCDKAPKGGSNGHNRANDGTRAD